MDNNYYNTFIMVADDCPVSKGIVPVNYRDKPTIATIQYSLAINNPYFFTQEDFLYTTYRIKNSVPDSLEYKDGKHDFFSKSQACLRASPLPKKYGWGIHFDPNGLIAFYRVESKEYQALSQDSNIQILKSMRNTKNRRITMEKYSVNGRLTAIEGKGKILLNILLEASEEMKKVDSCLCYIVGMSKDEADSVYVYEVWEDEAAHKASLELAVVKKLIKNAMPIIEGMSSYPELVIYGGKASL